MATFESLNWTDLDAWAILVGRGVVVLELGDKERSRFWLEQRQYETVRLDFSSGVSSAVAQLGTVLTWKFRFGYEMSPESRNLDALRDGFEFPVPEKGGLVLELEGFERAWHENQHWCSGLLAIASEFSLQQLALGKRFFAVVEVANNSSPVIGQEFEALSIGHPFRIPRESA